MKEKQKLLTQLKLLQEGQTDMRARMASAATERERLHSELEEMKRKLDESQHETRKLRSVSFSVGLNSSRFYPIGIYIFQA